MTTLTNIIPEANTAVEIDEDAAKAAARAAALATLPVLPRDERTNYIGLVVCEGPMRNQWKRQTARFYPEASAAIIDGPTSAAQIEKFVRQTVEDNTPGVMICSYYTLRTYIAALRSYPANDMYIDEAHKVLTGNGTFTEQCAWAVRDLVKRAFPLTGTPVNKDIDELGRLLAFARGQKDLFYGQQLSRFNLTQDGQAQRMADSIGPIMFRRDRSEWAQDLPKINHEAVRLTGTAAEIALSEALTSGLRDCIKDFEDKLALAEAMDPTNEAIKEARAAVRQAQGTAMAGIQAARRGISLPESLSAEDSAAVALVAASGVLQNAINDGGTKAEQVVELTANMANSGDAVVIFTDFPDVARILAKRLADEDVQAGLFIGGVAEKRRQQDLVAYTGTPCNVHQDTDAGLCVAGCPDCTQPTINVLICTGVADHGLDLQRTNVLINFEPVWTPRTLIQRIARMVRLGSVNDQVQVLSIIMDNTIEVGVAAKMLPRAMVALEALDGVRGVKAADSEMGNIAGAFADVLKPEDMAKQHEGMLKLAQEIFSEGQTATDADI